MIESQTRMISYEQERMGFRDRLDSALQQALVDKYPDEENPTLERLAPSSLTAADPEGEDPHEWIRDVGGRITSQWMKYLGLEESQEKRAKALRVTEPTGRKFQTAVFVPTYTPLYEVMIDGVVDAAVAWTIQTVERRQSTESEAFHIQAVMTELAVQIAGGVVPHDGIQRQGAPAGYLVKRKVLAQSPFTTNRINERLENIYFRTGK